MSDFEPVIIGFTCNWCSYRAADLAGTSRIKYPPNVRLIRVMCSGRIDPTFVLKALSEGADGVLIAGCHPGECHYLEQNYKALRRHQLLTRTLAQFGVEPERVRLTWASAAEGARFAEEIAEMVDAVKQLGPLNWPARPVPHPPLQGEGRGGDGVEFDSADSNPNPIPLPASPLKGEEHTAAR